MTTPPGSVTAPPNGGGADANNPDVLGGFATADQKSGYTITITNSDVRSRSGTTTGGVNSCWGVFSVGDMANCYDLRHENPD